MRSPFWDKRCKKLSPKLWLPEDNALGDPVECIPNTWFNSTRRKCIHKNNIKCYAEKSEDKIIRAKRVDIYPTSEQRTMILKWLNLYRIMYNKTVEYIHLHPEEKKNMINLRPKIKATLSPTLLNRIRLSKIPVHTLDNAISDVCKAYKTCFSNLRAKNIRHFKMYKKSIKRLTHSLVIEKQSFSKNKSGFCLRFLGKVKACEELSKKTVEHDSRLIYDKRTNSFYFMVPYQINPTKTQKKATVSIDPGLRTFASCYCNQSTLDLGIDTRSRLVKEFKKIDKIAEQKEKPWYSKKMFKLHGKIKNLVDDLHWKCANFLTQNASTVVIGKLSKDIVSKDNTLDKMSKRVYSAVSHFTFRRRLREKCQQRKVRFLEVDESYTTISCGKCGTLNYIGRSKVYECEKCNVILDRDYNGARNILLKNFNLLE